MASGRDRRLGRFSARRWGAPTRSAYWLVSASVRGLHLEAPDGLHDRLDEFEAVGAGVIRGT
jgi:hypothetical protein